MIFSVERIALSCAFDSSCSSTTHWKAGFCSFVPLPSTYLKDYLVKEVKHLERPPSPLKIRAKNFFSSFSKKSFSNLFDDDDKLES